RPRHGRLALGIGQPLERRRRDEHRQGHLGPEDGRRGRDLAHVDEGSRAQLPAREGLDVRPQRPLVARAAREVGVRAWVEPLPGDLLEVCDVDRLAHPRRIVSVSPSSSSDPPWARIAIPATAAPRSRSSSPSSTGAEDFVTGGSCRWAPRTSAAGSSSSPCRVSVCANPTTVASGVRKSWQASETSRAKRVSSVALSSMADSRQLLTHDLQASPSEVPLALSHAGVGGVQKAIRIRYGDTEKLIAAEIDCTVDLAPARKGVHMSRFPELFEEAIEEVVIGEALLIEGLAEHIAAHIVERQRALRAEVRISARYPLERETPVTGLPTQEMVSLFGIAAASEAGTRRIVGVEATGINACPCAQGLVRERAAERLGEAGFGELDVERILELVPLATHNQRGRGTLFVGTERASRHTGLREWLT